MLDSWTAAHINAHTLF